MDILSLVGRSTELFAEDIERHSQVLLDAIRGARFLIIGGAGSIGQAVTKEILKRNPRSLHVVDISENNTVELVRDIRSTVGYADVDFRSFAIDCGGPEFDAMCNTEGPYDYVFNLSALKHVRSEKDPYTLMRLITVNIENTLQTLRRTQESGAKKYFCVSTDKAANPVNMMGGSKRIMEMFLMRESLQQTLSMARFANVAFSDGSLLFGFNNRFAKQQPLAAPKDIKRYFITPKESGELCLLSGILGENREIFFPKLRHELRLTTFSDIAVHYLQQRGYEPYECNSENEARERADELIKRKKWPCYFFDSDTTGEKSFEEFYTDKETLEMDRFTSIGVIKNNPNYDGAALDSFQVALSELKSKGAWTKSEILELFSILLPKFDHKETGKYLDQKM